MQSERDVEKQLLFVGLPAATSTTTPRVKEMMVFDLPLDVEIPDEDSINDPKYAALMQQLGRASEFCGFPIDLFLQQLRIGGFASIRTSEVPIPRGSFDIMNEQGLIFVIADYKKPPISSKSNGLGICRGKIPELPEYSSRGVDDKDLNSLSCWPTRPNFIVPQEDSVLMQDIRLNSPKVQSVRIYDGLVYYTKRVPQFDTSLPTPALNYEKEALKHYCQEAESLASVVYNLQVHVYDRYKSPKIEAGYLTFTDNQNNRSAIDLRHIIMRADQMSGDNRELKRRIAQLSTISTVEQFIDLVLRDDELARCHAPVFTQKTIDGRVIYPPVMVHTGDTGEAIIRDADFQHFSINPLAPVLGFKSFNGSKSNTQADLLMALDLLKLRLNSPTRDSFKNALNKFIEERQITEVTLDPDALKKLNMPLTPNKVEFANLPGSKQVEYLLAKYNDYTTLDNNLPYIDYKQLKDFDGYEAAIDATIGYFEENPQEFKNVGESCAHDLVYLRKLGHDMAMHGDESGHPKNIPEVFERITTIYNRRIMVTNNEAQYLSVILSTRGLLDYTPGDSEACLIRVHPNWIRANNDTAKAWMDILTIQALKQGLLVADVTGKDLLGGFDIYVSCTIANMMRRIVKPTDNPPTIQEIQSYLTEHFARIRADLSDNLRSIADPAKQKELFIGKIETYKRELYIDEKYDAGARTLEHTDKKLKG